MIKSYIWTKFNRLIHLGLILCFAIAYGLEEIKEIFYLHSFFGVLFLVLILFRILWGLIGTKYSLFKDFLFSGLRDYFSSFLGEKKDFVGHNPASSIAIILMLLFGILTSVTGIMALGIQKQNGMFSSLYFKYSSFRWIVDWHNIFANMLLAIICIHILGALFDWLYHKKDLILSMISGYKTTQIYQIIQMTLFQKIVCFFCSALFVLICFYLINPSNLIIGEKKSISPYMESQSYLLYKKECGDCHIAYPPFLLSKQSIQTLMQGLENHFGDDVSLETKDLEQILKFLQDNALEKLDTPFRAYFSPQDKEAIAFTQTSLFLSLHKKIPQQTFNSPQIKSKANCQICHFNVENGRFYPIRR